MQLTIDELAAEAGMTVRNVRYYASLGLIPAPVRRGRIAYYGEDHLARLALVRALQEHGFTLQAVERFLAALPADITPADLAMQRAMITSWTSDPEALDRIGAELASLGLSRDLLAATQQVVERHMAGLATELAELYTDLRTEPWRRRHHTPAEAEQLEKLLPRIRELTLEGVVASFQRAVNDVIAQALTPTRAES
ncbi:MerR family transcriptional regulator [Nocardioides sp.]|uniref:MerR family transcriptional regulator n=1 Tax=Nocardioides sp. TaxID=35761 RepID=UPI0039E4569F